METLIIDGPQFRLTVLISSLYQFHYGDCLQHIPKPSSLLSQRRTTPTHIFPLIQFAILSAQVHECGGCHADCYDCCSEIYCKGCYVAGGVVVEVCCPDYMVSYSQWTGVRKWRGGENILLGVLQMQLINAIEAARLTAGCERLEEIQESWTMEEE